MIIKVDDNGVVKTAVIPTKTSEIVNDNYYSTLDANSATSILANSDLNDTDWLVTGSYFCPSVVIAASLSNAPSGLEDTFLLNVYNVSSNDPGSTSENSTHRLQEIMTCDGKSKWFRLCYSDSAGYWYYDDWTKSYPVEKVKNNITRITTNVDATLSNNGVTATTYPTTFDIRDKNELILNRLEAQVYSDGRIGGTWQVRNYDTAGTEITQKSIKMTLDKSGNLTYTVDEPAKFREAIGLGSAATYDVETTLANDSKLPTGSSIVTAINKKVSISLSFTAANKADFIKQILDTIIQYSAGQYVMRATRQGYYVCLCIAAVQSTSRAIVEVIPQQDNMNEIWIGTYSNGSYIYAKVVTTVFTTD